MQCCGGSCGNLRYAFSHSTVHMASDVVVGSVLYIGTGHAKYTVVTINSPFNADAGTGDTLLNVDAQSVTGSMSNLSFTKRDDGSVAISLREEHQLWGLHGHVRNSHKPTKRHDESKRPFLL